MDTEEGNDDNPLSLHKYLYANANPVDGLDPSGNDDIAAAMDMSETFDSMATIQLHSTMNAAVPIPSYPPTLVGRQLVGAVYAESSSQGTGGELPDEKIAIVETFLYEQWAACTSRWNRSFGNGTISDAIMTQSMAAKRNDPQWNAVMAGNSDSSDLRPWATVNQTLQYVPSRLHFQLSVLAVDTFNGGLSGGPEGADSLPVMPELTGIPIGFNKAFNSPPSKREKKIGRIGKTTFYGFIPGRELQ